VLRASLVLKKQKGHHPLRMMALGVAELVGTTSSGGEGASQKQPQAKQEDAKQQCEDRHDRDVGRQCRDAGVAADPHQIYANRLWLRQASHVKRVPWSVDRLTSAPSPAVHRGATNHGARSAGALLCVSAPVVLDEHADFARDARGIPAACPVESGRDYRCGRASMNRPREDGSTRSAVPPTQ
jgi:hypothetical protein